MRLFLTNILLAFLWLLLSSEFTVANFFFGYLICYAVFWLAFRNTFGSRYFVKGLDLLNIIVFILKEIVLSSFRVARDVLRSAEIEPSIISWQTNVSSDLELVVFSNIVTLTPGNLVLDYDENTKMLYIHLLNGKLEQNTTRDLAVLERKVKRLFAK